MCFSHLPMKRTSLECIHFQMINVVTCCVKTPHTHCLKALWVSSVQGPSRGTPLSQGSGPECMSLPSKPTATWLGPFLHLKSQQRWLSLCFLHGHISLWPLMFISNCFLSCEWHWSIFSCVYWPFCFLFVSSPFQVFVNFSIGNAAAFLPISFMELFHTLRFIL